MPEFPNHSVVGLCILLTLNVLLHAGTFLWSVLRKKQRHSYAKLLKLENDLKRAFYAIKVLSGNRWPDIRDEFTEEFPF